MQPLQLRSAFQQSVRTGIGNMPRISRGEVSDDQLRTIARDAYGPERLFWGTDITRLKCTWRQAITMYTEELPWLSERDKTLIMGEAFSRWFNWAPSAAA